ncbi:hypothetical protein ScPMuIL_004037 [Solemya velum]
MDYTQDFINKFPKKEIRNLTLGKSLKCRRTQSPEELTESSPGSTKKPEVVLASHHPARNQQISLALPNRQWSDWNAMTEGVPMFIVNSCIEYGRLEGTGWPVAVPCVRRSEYLSNPPTAPSQQWQAFICRKSTYWTWISHTY